MQVTILIFMHRKSYTGFRLVPKVVILNDLERVMVVILTNVVSLGLDTHCPAKINSTSTTLRGHLRVLVRLSINVRNTVCRDIVETQRICELTGDS